MVDIASKILFHDRVRFAITVSGVAFAVALVFVQTGLFSGLLQSATVTIDRADADFWVTSHNTANVDFAIPFSDHAVQRIRSVPGVERADNLIVWFLRISLPTGATEGLLVYALEDFQKWNLPWRVEEGDLDDLRRGRFLFLDESARRRFGGYQVGEFREVLDRRLQIVGRTSEAKSFTTTPIAFMDFHLAQELDPANLAGRTTYILVKLRPGADALAVQTEISRRLPYNDVHTRKDWARVSRGYWVDSTGIGLNMYLTVFLGCLVGVVVVAQTLYTSVMDHFKEFATVKAIGGSNWDIYGIIAKQAVIAAVAGFAVGSALCLAIRPAMAGIGLTLQIEPRFATIVFAGTVGLCLMASTLSFRKIASMDPAMVFRG